ncbi:MAG: YdcF family protein [bacterium]|nr:YdcF family protein [bacterium]
MPTQDKIDILAKKLWDYGSMHHKLKNADAIVVFGSYNPIVANRAAELFKEGWAPLIVFSGNRSDSTTSWEKTEAETMADIAIELGVPKDKILIEPDAKNSGENALFSKALLAKHGIYPKRVIVIQKPYAERRAYATTRARWPEVEVITSSPQLSYDQYMDTRKEDRNGSIATMVGDLQRIKIYAEKGYQIPQEIPPDVWQAYEELTRLGFNKWLT